jgi:hypothetical protein
MLKDSRRATIATTGRPALSLPDMDVFRPMLMMLPECLLPNIPPDKFRRDEIPVPSGRYQPPHIFETRPAASLSRNVV